MVRVLEAKCLPLKNRASAGAQMPCASYTVILLLTPPPVLHIYSSVLTPAYTLALLHLYDRIFLHNGTGKEEALGTRPLLLLAIFSNGSKLNDFGKGLDVQSTQFMVCLALLPQKAASDRMCVCFLLR